MNTPRQYVIGLVGSIGAGKSTVASGLLQRGALVIDADKVGHEVLQRPEIRTRLLAAFGDEIAAPDGTIARSRLGALVFADTGRRRQLEAIVHPVMRKVFEDKIAAVPPGAIVVSDAAVLCEAGWDDLCQVVVAVDAPRSVRLARLQASRGWTDEELRRREDAQMPFAAKAARVAIVFRNDATPEQCKKQVDQWYCQWLANNQGAVGWQAPPVNVGHMALPGSNLNQ